MYEIDKLEIIAVAREIKSIGLVQLTGGNLSVREDNGDVVITPSGMPYETMTPEQMLVLDRNGAVIEGTLRPSVDTAALLYIYGHMPEVRAIIHTHQPYATAIGLIGDEFPACCTTQCNVCLGSVNVAPYSAAASEDMGRQAVEHIGGRRAVILKHHGVITVGPTLREAQAACVYLEDAAKCYLAAKAAHPKGRPALMTPAQEAEAVNTFKDYGQKKR